MVAETAGNIGKHYIKSSKNSESKTARCLLQFMFDANIFATLDTTNLHKL